MDTKQKTETPEQTHDVKAVNDVDVSPDLINNEWDNIARDEGVSVDDVDSQSEFALHPDDETQQRDQAVSRVAALLGYVFGLGFVFFTPAWQVASDEVSRLAAVWARVTAKYLPLSWLGHIPDVSGGDGSECIECDAIAVTFQVIGPRINQPRQKISDDDDPAQSRAGSEVFRNDTGAVSEKSRNDDVMRDVHGQI